MTKTKRETPEERNGRRVKKRRERVREGGRKRGRIVRHEVRQSNVPPTCENLFMHEKAGKANERERTRETKEWAEMWQNDTAGSTKIKKGRKREQAREQTKQRERERRMNIPCLFVTFCLFFQHFIQKQRSNGTDAPQRDEMEWNEMGWDSMLRLAELRSDR